VSTQRDAKDLTQSRKRSKDRKVGKFPLFAFLPLTLLCFLVVWHRFVIGASQPANSLQRQSAGSATQIYGPPRVTGKLKSADINESSGLVASQTAGIYWTHNDSGDGPFLYAIDETGESRGVWKVTGASARDWEDIAAGAGPQRNKRYLYAGDIGDNDEKRREITIYRLPEPSITAKDSASTKRNPRVTEPAEAIRLRYPDGAHDAEAMLVHPTTGDLYIVTKVLLSNPSVYKAAAPLSDQNVQTLVKQGELNLPSLLGGIVTGGAISPDGRRIAFCDYLQGYELELPARSRSFDEIWKQPARIINLGKRPQGEAIAYRLDGKALLTTSEGLHAVMIQVLGR
jgi:hypothetical protein